MTLTKKDIVRNISIDNNISLYVAKDIFEKFISIIIGESFKSNKTLKLSGFGTFKTKVTPKRIGRNPKTKKSYIISSRKKLTLTPSKSVRDLFN